MTSRRTILRGIAGLMGATSLQGCGDVIRFFQPDLAAGTIDIHSHFFNGRDVPVVGFLEQTFIRDPHHEVEPNELVTVLLKLLKAILLTNTPTARAELEDIVSGDAPPTAATLERQDQANVSAALSEFAAGAVPDAAGFSVTRSDEARLLDQIATDVQQEALRDSFMTPRQQAGTLAAEIYARGSAFGLESGTDREYRHTSPLLQSIRWAGLLTRARRDVLAELIRLYGGHNQVRVFSPSIVDFTYWFKTDESDVESVSDQIEVVSAIAKRNREALIMPFCPFDPLRAALERERNPNLDSLRFVKHAVLERGFAGVKVYPPMGFRPWGNENIVLRWAKATPRGRGRALDAELERLYLWCVENDVPIKAHANNSISAGKGTGRFASPVGWRKVLEQPRFSSLRVNLAHFGGFDETRPGSQTADDQDWEAIIAAMISDYEGLYVDLGFWSLGFEEEGAERERLMRRTREVLDRVPLLTERMMYGSDWSMTGRIPGHQTYSADVVAALGELGIAGPTLAGIMGGNAARYLGMIPGSVQRARQAAFHGDNPIFREVFGN